MKKYQLIIFLLIAFGLLSSMTLDLENLFNYSNQTIPSYITKDNSDGNTITDEAATLGRVLFYDKMLSSNNTIACASCHHQEFAFGDTSLVSSGVNGITGRHSMRLVNSRFSDEKKFFWDERASSLESQSTMPIQDHVEMGYSGTNGDQDINNLIDKLDSISYYNDLFHLAFGDTIITEDRMQESLAQFIRSIQSFDSPYDTGRGQVTGDSLDFPNFSNSQNAGKLLFITPPELDANSSRTGGGFGCAHCHRPPEFDINPNTKSNGVVFTPGSTNANGGVDTIVFRSPSLRDIVNESGQVNGLLMHTGNFNNLGQVLNHYNRINLFNNVPGISEAIDSNLVPNGRPRNLNMTNQERNRVIDFLGTLTGSDIYTNEKWSDPFGEDGSLTILNSTFTSTHEIKNIDISIFPNPTTDYINIEGEIANNTISLINAEGRAVIQSEKIQHNKKTLSLGAINSGIYIVQIKNKNGQVVASESIVKK